MYKGIPIPTVIPTHSILLPDPIHVSCGSWSCFLRPSECNWGHLPDHGYGIVHRSLMGSLVGAQLKPVAAPPPELISIQ